jgi:uncharacterized protein (TIGR03790 family)
VRLSLCLLFALLPLHAQTGDQVLLVVNRSDSVSRQAADYYRPRRAIPQQNVCYLETTTAEEIAWDVYVAQIERPIAACLAKNGLREKILYIALTMGVPLKVDGGSGGQMAEHASVDSELALLYAKMGGLSTFVRAGSVPNPFFMQRQAPFRHPRFPIYLVTRLAAYGLAEVKSMIDRSLAARNRGKFVIDLSAAQGGGNDWLRTAAMLLPPDRIVVD